MHAKVLRAPAARSRFTEAKNGLSALIDHVRGGETVLIVDRGIPVARLESAVRVEEDGGGRLARLQRTGAIHAAADPIAREVLLSAPPAARAGASGVRALIDERRAGR